MLPHLWIRPRPASHGGLRSGESRLSGGSAYRLRAWDITSLRSCGRLWTVPIRQFGDAANSPLDSNLPKQTGIIQDNNGGNGWGIEVQPEITIPEPTPFHIQAIEYEVESS